MEKLNERIRSKIQPQGECWVWTASTTHDGYGRLYIEGKTHVASRAIYEMLVGLVPNGLTLDHLCRNRACVNPDHLEPVTMRVNILRGEGLAAKLSRQTHCKRGHEFTLQNTGVSASGGRRCRACYRAATAAWVKRMESERRCVKCGKPATEVNRRFCEAHAEWSRARQRVAR